jgi:hypothetical protein
MRYIKQLWSEYYDCTETEQKLLKLYQLRDWYDLRSDDELYELGVNPDDVHDIEDDIVKFNEL